MDILNNIPLLNIIIPAIAAILATLLTFKINKTKIEHSIQDQFRDDILKELQSLRDEVKYWSEKYHDIVKQYSELKAEMQLLEREFATKIDLFESAHTSLPLPMWLKDPDGRMLSLNDAYEYEFLRPLGLRKEDYIGKFDIDVWSKEIAEIFKEHDQQVYLTGKVWEGVELIERSNRIEEWQIIKYARYNNGIKIGIGGIAIKKIADVKESPSQEKRQIRNGDKLSNKIHKKSKKKDN